MHISYLLSKITYELNISFKKLKLLTIIYNIVVGIMELLIIFYFNIENKIVFTKY